MITAKNPSASNRLDDLCLATITASFTNPVAAATEAQINALYTVVRKRGMRDLVGLCNAIWHVGAYCDGQLTRCAHFGEPFARSVASQIIAGHSVAFRPHRKGDRVFSLSRREASDIASQVACLV